MRDRHLVWGKPNDLAYVRAIIREKGWRDTPFVQWLLMEMLNNDIDTNMTELGRQVRPTPTRVTAAVTVLRWFRDGATPSPASIAAIAKRFKTTPQHVLRLLGQLPAEGSVEPSSLRRQLNAEIDELNEEQLALLLNLVAVARAGGTLPQVELQDCPEDTQVPVSPAQQESGERTH